MPNTSHPRRPAESNAHSSKTNVSPRHSSKTLASPQELAKNVAATNEYFARRAEEEREREQRKAEQQKAEAEALRTRTGRNGLNKVNAINAEAEKRKAEDDAFRLRDPEAWQKQQDEMLKKCQDSVTHTFTLREAKTSDGQEPVSEAAKSPNKMPQPESKSTSNAAAGPPQSSQEASQTVPLLAKEQGPVTENPVPSVQISDLGPKIAPQPNQATGHSAPTVAAASHSTGSRPQRDFSGVFAGLNQVRAKNAETLKKTQEDRALKAQDPEAWERKERERIDKLVAEAETPTWSIRKMSNKYASSELATVKRPATQAAPAMPTINGPSTILGSTPQLASEAAPIQPPIGSVPKTSRFFGNGSDFSAAAKAPTTASKPSASAETLPVSAPIPVEVPTPQPFDYAHPAASIASGHIVVRLPEDAPSLPFVRLPPSQKSNSGAATTSFVEKGSTALSAYNSKLSSNPNSSTISKDHDVRLEEQPSWVVQGNSQVFLASSTTSTNIRSHPNEKANGPLPTMAVSSIAFPGTNSSTTTLGEKSNVTLPVMSNNPPSASAPKATAAQPVAIVHQEDWQTRFNSLLRKEQGHPGANPGNNTTISTTNVTTTSNSLPPSNEQSAPVTEDDVHQAKPSEEALLDDRTFGSSPAIQIPKVTKKMDGPTPAIKTDIKQAKAENGTGFRRTLDHSSPESSDSEGRPRKPKVRIVLTLEDKLVRRIMRGEKGRGNRTFHINVSSKR